MKDVISFITANRGKPVVLEGCNFSGRTALLHRWASECSGAGLRAIYVGPSIQQSISSLLPTVGSELQLHVAGARHAETILSLAESFGLRRCWQQSPFTLSGGEQTLLVALCKLGLEPAFLAFDGGMEELDSRNAARLAEAFSSTPAESTAALLTINGYVEDRSWNSLPHVRTSDLTHASETSEPPRFDASDFHFSASPNTACFEAKDLSFAYASKCPILRETCFRLEPGEIVSLEGRNGAGKSTLARILVGVLPLHHGQITVGGRTFDPWKSPGKIAVMHMQNPDVQLFANTVAGELADLPEPSRDAAAALAGVRNLMTEHPFDLPFVLRKRLTFSAVAHLSRSWFIFDEPTLGQDAAACDQMVTVLRRIAGGGAGVVVISHSREFIRRLNARRLRLENGEVSELGSATS